MFSGNAHGPANVLFAFFEDAVCALSDVFGGDARHALAAHREGDCIRAVGCLLGSHVEHVHVVPVKRSLKQRQGRTHFDEHLVGFTLGVEMRNFVFALKGRHPVVAERHPFSCVFQR